MDLMVCVGSSCHLKSSRELVDIFSKLIEKNNLQDKISLKGSFCMGLCGEPGIGVKFNNEKFSVNLSDAETFFKDNVLGSV